MTTSTTTTAPQPATSTTEAPEILVVDTVAPPSIASEVAAGDSGGSADLRSVLAVGGLVVLNLAAFGMAALRLLAGGPASPNRPTA